MYGPAVEALARKVAADAGALTDEWNGYAVLQPTSAATGALDVGFVPGPTALPLSKLKVVYLLGEDGLALHDMASDAFVVYQGHHGDAGAESADLVLPAAAYTEQSGTYVNTEGRVQRAARAADRRATPERTGRSCAPWPPPSTCRCRTARSPTSASAWVSSRRTSRSTLRRRAVVGRAGGDDARLPGRGGRPAADGAARR